MHFCTGESNGSDAAWNHGSSQVTANSPLVSPPSLDTSEEQQEVSATISSLSLLLIPTEGKIKSAKKKKTHKRNRAQEAVNRHQHNYEETSADRISNKRQFGFSAKRNSSSSTGVHSVFFPQGPRCHQTHQNINCTITSRLSPLTVDSGEECKVFVFSILTKRRCTNYININR